MRCADCRYFERAREDYAPASVDKWPGCGHCSRWHHSYRDDPSKFASNDCWVESDEGWANMVGPEFGCVLFEPRKEREKP